MSDAGPDPELSPGIDPWAQGHSIEVLREVAAGIKPSVQGFDVEPVNAGGVPAEWVVANGVAIDAPVVLYFHGGAFLCGAPEQYRNVTVGLSRTAKVRVLSVDYRLAPEYAHPAAFEDALQAYRWLLQLPGVTAGKLVVAGDSAGASIATSLALNAQAHTLAAPACVIANSPFVDLALASPSLNDPNRNVGQPNKETVQWLARTYLEADATPISPTEPRHSPVYRDLTRLPPLLVQTAGLDNLQHDGLRLAAQGIRYGVDVQYTEYPTAAHIWVVLSTPDQDDETAEALTEMAEFIQQHCQ